MRKSLIATIFTAALMAGAGTASAAGITFFGEDLAGGSLPTPNSDAAAASFLGSLIGVSTETFETFAPGPQVSPIVVTFGLDTASLAGGGMIIRDAQSAGRFAISPTQYLENRPGLTLTFSAPQAAFGFYGTDIGDFGGQLSISFDGGPAMLVPHTLGTNGDPNGTALFFGYIDVADPFTTVLFINTDESDAFGFDNFTIGRQEQVRIPEPGVLALLAIALLGFGAARRGNPA